MFFIHATAKQGARSFPGKVYTAPYRSVNKQLRSEDFSVEERVRCFAATWVKTFLYRPGTNDHTI